MTNQVKISDLLAARLDELEAQHLESYKRLQARLERIQVGLDELKELNKLG